MYLNRPTPAIIALVVLLESHIVTGDIWGDGRLNSMWPSQHHSRWTWPAIWSGIESCQQQGITFGDVDTTSRVYQMGYLQLYHSLEECVTLRDYIIDYIRSNTL